MVHDAILLLTGVVVGLANSIAGGGMLVGFPVLLGLGYSPLVANASGAVVTPLGQATSAYGYRRYIRKVPPRYALLLIPSVLGAAAGALTLRNTSAEHFADIVPVLVLFAVLLFAAQPFLHFHLHRHIKRKRRSLSPIFWIGLAILPASFYGGYFGPGYGFMMLAFLGFTKMPDVHMINGMKNVAAVFVSATSILCLATSGLIDWRVGLMMGAGSAIGGIVGSRIAQRMSSHWLRIAIVIFGIATAAYLGIRDY